MAGKERSAKDKEMASRMKKEGQKAPACWHGVGSDDRVNASRMGTAYKGKFTSTWSRGIMGGILAERLGFKMPAGFEVE